jgi:hypothetical protein
LIEKTTTTKLTKDNKSWTIVADGGTYNDHVATILYDLLLIYHHILGIYLTYSVLKWPAEVNNKVLLNKIYAIIFYNMIEIQTKLSEVFRLQKGMPSFSKARVGQVFNPMLQQLIQNTFLLEPENIVKILQDFRKQGMHQDIVPLLKIAWEIGFAIYPYTDPTIGLLSEQRDKLKDWKHAVEYYYLSKNKKIDLDKEI